MVYVYYLILSSKQPYEMSWKAKFHWLRKIPAVHQTYPEKCKTYIDDIANFHTHTRIICCMSEVECDLIFHF